MDIPSSSLPLANISPSFLHGILPHDLTVSFVSRLPPQDLESLCKSDEQFNSLFCDKLDFWIKLYKTNISDTIPTALVGNKDVIKKKYLEIMKEYYSSITNKAYDKGLINMSKEGAEKLVKVLIDENANVNAADSYGTTALMEAAENGHLGVVKYLISKGADFNAATLYGKTALIFAASNGHLEVVKYLISVEANPFLIDNDGKTAKDLAKSEEIRRLLDDYEEQCENI